MKEFLYNIFGCIALFLVVSIPIIAILALIFIGPFMAIWAINTLFGLEIAYTVKTYFAAMVLVFFLKDSTINSVINKKKNNVKQD